MIQFQNDTVTIFESALFRTTSTLLETKDFILLVDPTWLPHEIEVIQQKVASIKDHRPFFLLFTHSDYDHIIAWKAFPDATTIVSKAFVDNPDKEKVLQQIIEFDHSYYVQRNYPIAYPDGDIVITYDGQALTIGETTLHFFMAPGHNADGMFTIIQPLGIWIAGDYLSNIEFPFLYHSCHEYEKTLKKANTILGNFRIRMLIPGHGDHTTSIREIEKRRAENLKYLDHLKAMVTGERAFPENALWDRYTFKEGMKNFHNANIKLLTEELKLI